MGVPHVMVSASAPLTACDRVGRSCYAPRHEIDYIEQAARNLVPTNLPAQGGRPLWLFVTHDLAVVCHVDMIQDWDSEEVHASKDSPLVPHGAAAAVERRGVKVRASPLALGSGLVAHCSGVPDRAE